MKKKIKLAVYIVGGIILFIGLILGAGILILNLTDCDPGEKNTSYPEYVEIANDVTDIPVELEQFREDSD